MATRTARISSQTDKAQRETLSNSSESQSDTKLGCVQVRIGEIKHKDAPDLLMLDFDELINIADKYVEIRNTLEFLGITCATCKLEKSQSGTGYHCVIVMAEDLPLINRICLQLILGSDPKRETINYHRATLVTEETRTGYENLLFSGKESVLYEHGTSDPASTKTGPDW
jgi:hypothetical protein